MKVDVLRCWKTDRGFSGEYYVYTNHEEEKHLVVQNDGDIKIVAHFAGKEVADCVAKPTQAVIDAVIMASVDNLLKMTGMEE